MIQSQLTDQQLILLLNLAEIEEVESRAWSRLKTDFTFNSFPLYTTGTISVTQNSPIVQGTGTAWTSQMQGMVLRPGQSTGTGQLVPIPIDVVNVATQTITLRSPYPTTSQSSLGYGIFPMFYSIQGMQEVLGIRQLRPLGKTSHDAINLIDPYRYQSSSPAICWAPFGLDHDDNALAELYPIETAANVYSVYGLRQHIDLENPTDMPLIPSAVLVNKAAMKACESLLALTGDERWSNQRDYFAGRFQYERDTCIERDTQTYGAPAQIQDSVGDPDTGGYYPGIDYIASRALPWERG